MSNPATPPGLEQRLNEIKARCKAVQAKWHGYVEEHNDFLYENDPTRECLRLCENSLFLISALREALATVEKLGDLVDDD
jgi:hypothetical protein